MSQEINGYDIIKNTDGKLFFVVSFGPDDDVYLIKYEEGKTFDVEKSLKLTIKINDLDKYTVHMKSNCGYGGN